MFKKLNLLLKSRLNDVLGDNPVRRSSLDSKRLGKDLDREVDYLRKQINDAITYEEGLQEKVTALMQEATQLDLQADEAVANGNDSEARHLIGKLQRIQQRLTIAESDLREHQIVTQDLIQKVNTLDALVAEAKHQGEINDTSNETEESTDASNQSSGVISNILKDTREAIGNIGDNITTLTNRVSSQNEQTTSSNVEVTDDSDHDVISDDLETRRQRLSKPKK